VELQEDVGLEGCHGTLSGAGCFGVASVNCAQYRHPSAVRETASSGILGVEPLG
jgi:hypothetical protein